VHACNVIFAVEADVIFSDAKSIN